MQGTNTLTYLFKFVNNKCKRFYNIGPRPQWRCNCDKAKKVL
jgi:hypothetical protein